MKDHICQKKILGNLIFFCTFSKDNTFFPYKYDINLLSKKQMWYSPKNVLQDDNSGITEKSDIHHRKYGISSDRKIKDDIKVYSFKYA